MELNFWSILYTAAIVNNSSHSLDGQTAASLSYLAIAQLSVDIE